MKVPVLLKSLARGELSNLFMGQDGEIVEEKVPKVIQTINDGLLRFYTKFLLKERSLIIEMRENITNYHLLLKFCYSNYDPGNLPTGWDAPYILDTPTEPFLEDVIKVLAVFNYAGLKLPLNDINNRESVFTPQPLIIQYPYPVSGRMFSVEYQAKHKPIPESEYEDIDVDLPEFLMPALRYFVASEIYSQMNTQENIMKGQEYLGKFNQACQDAIDMGLINDVASTTNNRFEQNGWI